MLLDLLFVLLPAMRTTATAAGTSAAPASPPTASFFGLFGATPGPTPAAAPAGTSAPAPVHTSISPCIGVVEIVGLPPFIDVIQILEFLPTIGLRALVCSFIMLDNRIYCGF